MIGTKSRDRGKSLNALVGVGLLILVAPYLFVVVVLYSLFGFVLSLAIWLCWCVRGRNLLFVYSESPIWQEYIEKEILPQLAGRAVVLNWSERKQWKFSLAVLAFRRYGGERDFNPLAVVFRPFHRSKILRFYAPFKEFKHGQTGKVEQLKAELFAILKASR